jgi:hypothetical protein
MVIVPGRSRAEASSEDVVTTRKQRRPVRPRLEAEPRVEEREILRRESDDGGRDFFGGLFGGQRDWGLAVADDLWTRNLTLILLPPATEPSARKAESAVHLASRSRSQ